MNRRGCWLARPLLHVHDPPRPCPVPIPTGGVIVSPRRPPGNGGLRTPYAILSSNAVYSDGARVAPKYVMERRSNLAAPAPAPRVGGFFREECGPAVVETTRPRPDRDVERLGIAPATAQLNNWDGGLEVPGDGMPARTGAHR
jgi:hypothetical protein